MSQTLDQIFITNPAAALISTDLIYLSRSPYTSGNDYAITAANFIASVGVGNVASITGTVNQVIASSPTGAVNLSLPQSIATTSAVSFSSVKFTGNNGLIDSNGNEILALLPTSSAVNYLALVNSATGNGPLLQSLGSDTNIHIGMQSKGTGSIFFQAAVIGEATTIAIDSGTTFQHTTNIVFADTANTRTVTFPDASGTIAFTSDFPTLGTGVATALSVNVGTAGSFVVNGGSLGTPSSGTLTNATGLPIAGTTGYGSGVAAALAVNVTGSGAIVLANSPTFVTGTITSPSITFSSTSGIIGTTTNNNAAPLSVGEFVDGGQVSAVSFTTTGMSQNMTSISLTAGDWDIDFSSVIFFTGTVSTGACIGSVSITSATVVGSGLGIGGWYIAVPLGSNASYPLSGHTRLSLSTTTTVYLVGEASWTGTAPNFYCQMTARRRR